MGLEWPRGRGPRPSGDEGCILWASHRTRQVTAQFGEVIFRIEPALRVSGLAGFFWKTHTVFSHRHE